MFVGHERQHRLRFEPRRGDMFQTRRLASYTALRSSGAGRFGLRCLQTCRSYGTFKELFDLLSVDSRMNKKKRQEKILEILNKHGSVDVSELAKHFKLTEMSIRNDLNALSSQGKLQRTYGGALSRTTSTLELSLREKQERNLRAKSIIGKRAAALIQNGDTIMLDSGTTTQQVAKNLTEHKSLTVITNGINIINTIAGIEEIALYTVGGHIGTKSYAIVGPEAEQSLKKYFAKLCVISVEGVDLEKGLTSNSQMDAHITMLLIERTNKRILVADSSKIGQIALIPVCPLEKMDILVTDENAPESFIAEAKNRKMEVLTATG